nr:uncharacterized protein LOC109173561 [Ipomoea batatas]
MRPGGMEGGIPWKMSFMAWRVFRNKVPTDDVLSRFGFNVVSRCFCCNDPKQCTLQRVFCTGDVVAREVWTYFGQTLGVRLHMYGIRQVRYDWWGRESGRCNRLPVLVIWELWVQYISSRYGSGGGVGGFLWLGSFFKVVKGLSECIIRKWPEWELWVQQFSYDMAEHLWCCLRKHSKDGVRLLGLHS